MNVKGQSETNSSFGITRFLDLVRYPGIVANYVENVSETGPVSLVRRGERANFNHWSLSAHLKAETDPVSESLCLVFIYNSGR
jgi:hypothetical protein